MDKSDDKDPFYYDIQEDLKNIDELSNELRKKLVKAGKIKDESTSQVVNILPFLLGRGKPGITERTRSWLGLLVTGIGIVLFWRGIWDVSVAFFSDEVSLLMGASILIVMAIIGKRRVFKIFGGS